MIIDVHSHLGDVLNPNGGELIFRKGARKPPVVDLITAAEWRQYKTNPVSEWLLKVICEDQITKAVRARTVTGSLENFRKSMDESGVVKAACMPIAPYVTFADLKKAAAADAGIIPFTSVDLSINQDPEPLLRQDVADGARGLKLHPIIQKEPLHGKKMFQVVEAFAPYKLPVLFHSGVQSYYLGREKLERQRPEYGNPKDAVKLCTEFPTVSFIAGHAGLFQYRDTIEVLSRLKNVYVDTSFMEPKNIRKLVKAFGPERVMYASDWPCGNRTPNVESVAEACKGDKSLERLIYYENAARLLGIST